MFLRPDTLKGDKKKIYVAFKVLKYVMDVDVTSYMVRSNYRTFLFNNESNILSFHFRSSGPLMTNFSTQEKSLRTSMEPSTAFLSTAVSGKTLKSNF